MARQVLTYPDIPPVLTQAAGDARYSLVAHNHDAAYATVAHLHTGVYLPVAHEPGVDPHAQYYNQARGDARYLQTATAATIYLPLSGGTLTGPLIAAPTATEAYSLVARNDRARASFQANTDTVIGRVGEEYSGSGMHLSNNLRTTAASGGWQRDDAAKLGAALSIGSGTTILNLSSSAAASGNTPATLVNRMQMLPNGQFSLAPDAGGIGLLIVGPNAAGDTTEQVWVRKTTLPRIVPWHQARSIIRIDQRSTIQGDVGGDGLRMASNVYFDTAGAWRRIQAGAWASMLSLSAGTLSFDNSPDGADDGALAFTSQFSVDVTGHAGLNMGGAAMPAWNTNHPALMIGRVCSIWGGSSGLTAKLMQNSYYDQAGAYRCIWASQPASQVEFESGSFKVNHAAAVAAGAVQTFATRFSAPMTGNIIIAPAAGQSLELNCPAGYIHPTQDNSTTCGYSGLRWVAVYAVAGAINTSTYEMKEDFAPLDPATCATAVLETDWVNFVYRPPEYHGPEEIEGEEPKNREANLSASRTAHVKMVAETQAIRQQKGYVLNSPVHKTHDLFGLEDRKSASPSSDLAVVACALQHCLLEIAELKARLA